MAQEQNYQVNYSINVDASQGTKQVIAFGEAALFISEGETIEIDTRDGSYVGRVKA